MSLAIIPVGIVVGMWAIALIAYLLRQRRRKYHLRLAILCGYDHCGCSGCDDAPSWY